MIGRIDELRSALDEKRMLRRLVGLVPTMGYLHEGHGALLRSARDGTDVVVMSIFVNPLQFGPNEDLARYPRDLERDLALAKREGVDYVFAPADDEMYPAGFPSVTVDPGPVGQVLEGATRPTHFRGVLTVVAKLFGIVGPCQAFLGEKDAQQLFLVRRMVQDLELEVDLTSVPTVREEDGLAMSSRNSYLSGEERKAATCLYRALTRAVELVRSGERRSAVVSTAMHEIVDREPLARLDYATVVSEATFEQMEEVPAAGEWRVTTATGEQGWTSTMAGGGSAIPLPEARAVIAAWVGKTRLIDNMPLP